MPSLTPTPSIIVRNVSDIPIALKITTPTPDSITIHPKSTTRIHSKFIAALATAPKALRRLA